MADEPTTQSTSDPTPTPAVTGGTEDKPQFTQAQLDAVVSDRLARQQRAIDAKASKDREEADAERKRQQGEFESLATTAQARVKELEAHQTQHESVVDAYDTALTTRIKAETKDWPEEARAALPKDADALELADAVERLRPLALKLAGAGRTPGTTQGPRTATPSREDVATRERTALFSRGFGARM